MSNLSLLILIPPCPQIILEVKLKKCQIIIRLVWYALTMKYLFLELDFGPESFLEFLVELGCWHIKDPPVASEYLKK